jgi:hypothetical protein
MIPNLKLIVYGIAVAALLAAGLYIRSLHKEAARVPGLTATINAQHDQLTSERQNATKALEHENTLRKDLETARSTAAALAARLRRAYAANVPPVAPSAAEPAGTPGTGGGDDAPGDGGPAGRELDSAVAGVIGACRSDSIKLQGWQSWYESALPLF